jgi:glyoxylase-like metal-dependent hydrolase (beta-lactamase superfamily II)
MEITPEIHQVDGVNGNCYIIIRDTLTIIDTGRPGDGAKILKYITKNLGRTPSDISTIILTHYHLDHVGGVTEIKKAAPDAKIAAHAAEAAYVAGTVPIPVSRAKAGFFKRIRKLFEKREFFNPDLLLWDGDHVEGLITVHTPGHTPGSLGLLDEKTRAFFSGDVFRYNGNILVEGPEEHTQDRKQEQESIRRIATLDIDILLVGHGIPLKPGAGEKIRGFAKTLPG